MDTHLAPRTAPAALVHVTALAQHASARQASPVDPAARQCGTSTSPLETTSPATRTPRLGRRCVATPVRTARVFREIGRQELLRQPTDLKAAARLIAGLLPRTNDPAALENASFRLMKSIGEHRHWSRTERDAMLEATLAVTARRLAAALAPRKDLDGILLDLARNWYRRESDGSAVWCAIVRLGGSEFMDSPAFRSLLRAWITPRSAHAIVKAVVMIQRWGAPDSIPPSAPDLGTEMFWRRACGLGDKTDQRPLPEPFLAALRREIAALPEDLQPGARRFLAKQVEPMTDRGG